MPFGIVAYMYVFFSWTTFLETVVYLNDFCLCDLVGLSLVCLHIVYFMASSKYDWIIPLTNVFEVIWSFVIKLILFHRFSTMAVFMEQGRSTRRSCFCSSTIAWRRAKPNRKQRRCTRTPRVWPSKTAFSCFGFSSFPLFSKTNTFEFQFDLESVPN